MLLKSNIEKNIQRIVNDNYDDFMFSLENSEIIDINEKYNHVKKNDVRLISVIENIDDSPEGIMMAAVLEGMAEYYSQNLAREVRKGMHENALKGIHTGGKPPLGYDVDPETKKLVLNEPKAEIVRYIYKQASAGVGYNTIAHELNARGCRTKVGEKFSKNSLHTILSNEKYCGTYIFNKTASADIDGKRNSNRHKDDDEIIRLENAIQIGRASCRERV